LKYIRIWLIGIDDSYVDRLVSDDIYLYLADLEKSFDQNKPYAPQFRIEIIKDYLEDL
jgi:hypothetical protein